MTSTRGAIGWTVTVAATALSTYALDLVATAGGLALVATGVLHRTGTSVLVVALLASYLLWVLGLRTALGANADLLERTGVSTSLLSKVAWQVARRRSDREPVRRRWSMVGYVAWELAKEVPYYLGAATAVLVVDALTLDDGLIFLVGANVAAALYEFALGRGTHAWLTRRRFASFESEWVPGNYLADYYTRVEEDERHTIAFLVQELRRLPAGQTVLVFGTGPTLHHVFAVAARAAEIHLTDYLPGNLDEIRRWLDHDPAAHDWRPFVSYTLQCEGIARPTAEQIEQREARTRAAITRLLFADARQPHPVPGSYPVVLSAYCVDSATADRDTWTAMMRNVIGLTAAGGTFITAALRRCRSYQVGGSRFPCADVDEADLRTAIEPWFADTTVLTCDVSDATAHGYQGIVLATGRCRLVGSRPRCPDGRSTVMVAR